MRAVEQNCFKLTTLKVKIQILNLYKKNSIILHLPFLRVINSNFCGTRVSKLIFNCVKPAFFKDSNFFDRTIPFVVIAKSLKFLRDDSLSVKKIAKYS